MLVVDTSVLVYATGTDHPLREPAIRLFRDVAAKQVQATTTPEVLQEYAHVRGKRLDRPSTLAQAERFGGLLAPLTVVGLPEMLDALRLWSSVPTVGAFDAVLASIALARDWSVVSSDKGFGSVSGLNWVDLAAY
jgi:predicted nucleic acid-binding protein